VHRGSGAPPDTVSSVLALASIPSPTRSVWHLGPLPIRAYALCIVAGVLIGIWFTVQRWRARGGTADHIWDICGWAVLFGIIGGRLYHVLTDPELYFGDGKHPVDAFKIWDGGLGIWGAVALGALGAWIGCRRHRMDFLAFADAAAPGVLLAQAIGRWGNWFNNELYGRATSLPWKLQIHELDVVSGKAARDSAGHAIVLGYYHPAFLYEMLWNLLVVALLLWADHRRLLGRGQVLALYVMGYTFGRFWVEALRDDHANRILGMRVNSWVSILVFLAALAWFLRQRGAPRSVAVPAVPDAVPAAPDDEAAVADDEPADGSADPATGETPAGAGSHRSAGAAIDSGHVQHAEGRSQAPANSPAHGPGAGDGAASPDR
jgi:prolipoprotein diacylglyceryl transferase